MKKIKCFIIGLGNISVGYDKDIKKKDVFYTHAKSIEANKSLELIGGTDSSKKKRERFFKIYKKPTFKDINKPLSILKPSMLILSTPTNTHLSCVKEIALHKCVKFLICEKPLSYKIQDAKKIVEICKKNKIRLFINYFRISDPSTQKLKKIFINKKNITGTVFYSRGFFNNSSHFFNLFEYIFGNFINGQIINKVKRYNKYDFSCNFVTKFNKAQILFKCKDDRFDKFSINLYCRNNSIKYLNNGKKIILTNKNKKSKEIKNSSNRYQMNVYDEFIKYISKKKYNLCTGKEALKTTNNMYKVLNSEKF